MKLALNPNSTMRASISSTVRGAFPRERAEQHQQDVARIAVVEEGKELGEFALTHRDSATVLGAID